jgi:hypothetical protein
VQIISEANFDHSKGVRLVQGHKPVVSLMPNLKTKNYNLYSRSLFVRRYVIGENLFAAGCSSIPSYLCPYGCIQLAGGQRFDKQELRTSADVF